MADDLFSKVSELLADPEMSSKIKEVASGLSDRQESAIPSDPEVDKLKKAFAGLTANNRETALLMAIKPYLRASRAAKIDSAIQAARIAGILKSL